MHYYYNKDIFFIDSFELFYIIISLYLSYNDKKTWRLMTKELSFYASYNYHWRGYNFQQFRLSSVSNVVNDVWGTIWVGVVSGIWRHRNSVTFDRGVVDALEVFALVQVNVWSWIYAKSCCNFFTYPQLDFELSGLYEAGCLMLSWVGFVVPYLSWKVFLGWRLVRL